MASTGPADARALTNRSGGDYDGKYLGVFVQRGVSYVSSSACKPPKKCKISENWHYITPLSTRLGQWGQRRRAGIRSRVWGGQNKQVSSREKEMEFDPSILFFKK